MNLKFSIILSVILILVGLVTIFVVVDDAKQNKSRFSIHAPMSHGVTDGYSTIVIDSCEYIEASNQLAHKGNCKFCAERYRNELLDTERIK